jgi:hypothetical protein
LNISPVPNASFCLFFLMIQNLFGIMTGIAHKWQVINISAVHPTKTRGNASKKIVYLPSPLVDSLQTHGIASVARLQREGVSMIKDRIRWSSRISTWVYEGFTSSCKFANDFLANAVQMLTKSTGSTASFETHGKYTANLITFYWQWRSFQMHPLPH